jgi:hypothetical protein
MQLKPSVGRPSCPECAFLQTTSDLSAVCRPVGIVVKVRVKQGAVYVRLQDGERQQSQLLPCTNAPARVVLWRPKMGGLVRTS